MRTGSHRGLPLGPLLNDESQSKSRYPLFFLRWIPGLLLPAVTAGKGVARPRLGCYSGHLTQLTWNAAHDLSFHVSLFLRAGCSHLHAFFSIFFSWLGRISVPLGTLARRRESKETCCRVPTHRPEVQSLCIQIPSKRIKKCRQVPPSSTSIQPNLLPSPSHQRPIPFQPYHHLFQTVRRFNVDPAPSGGSWNPAAFLSSRLVGRTLLGMVSWSASGSYDDGCSEVLELGAGDEIPIQRRSSAHGPSRAWADGTVAVISSPLAISRNGHDTDAVEAFYT